MDLGFLAQRCCGGTGGIELRIQRWTLSPVATHLVRDSSSGWLGLDGILQIPAIKKSPNDLAEMTCY
jgi:hypothetical protein